MASKVSHVKLGKRTKEEIYSAVRRAMELADWKNYVKGNKIFVKINSLSMKCVPGQCTSPWVLDAVLEMLKGKEVIVGDADVATAKQVERAFKAWGFDEVCKKHGAKLINLSKEECVDVRINGVLFESIKIPKVIKEFDSRITLPVLKTHNVSKMTFAMKNQWGCIPRFRQKYHLVLDKAIPEINKAVGIDFALGDMTVCLEDNAPLTGKPKVCDRVVASNDLVAIDSFASKFADLGDLGYVSYADKIGLGSKDFSLVGDSFEVVPFRKAIVEKHPIVSVEMFLRKIPVISWLVFDTFLFKIPAWIATKYNYVIWYGKKGRHYGKDLISKDELYREEFGKLVK